MWEEAVFELEEVLLAGLAFLLPLLVAALLLWSSEKSGSSRKFFFLGSVGCAGGDWAHF